VNPKIFLVDDEENILKQMRWALEPDYEVLTSSVEGEALSLFEKEKLLQCWKKILLHLKKVVYTDKFRINFSQNLL